MAKEYTESQERCAIKMLMSGATIDDTSLETGIDTEHLNLILSVVKLVQSQPATINPVMQEGDLTTDDWNNADLHTQAKSDNTEWYNPFGAPRTSQDDDFGAHKSNVL